MRLSAEETWKGIAGVSAMHGNSAALERLWQQAVKEMLGEDRIPFFLVFLKRLVLCRV